MKDFLEYLIKEITGENNFEIEEISDNDRVTLNIHSQPELIGLIIGKNGKTIKAIQNLLRVRGKLEKKSVFINVSEANSE